MTSNAQVIMSSSGIGPLHPPIPRMTYLPSSQPTLPNGGRDPGLVASSFKPGFDGFLGA